MQNIPLTYEVIIPRRRSPFSVQGGCATLETLNSCPAIGKRLGWPIAGGRAGAPVMSWAPSWTADTALGSAPLYPGGILVSGLIDQSGGKAATAISIVATATSSFDPRQIYVALLRDLNGTDYESPPNPDLGPEYGSRPMAGARPESGSGFQIYRTVIAAPASWAPGFRVWLPASEELTEAVNIAVSVKQA